MKNCKHSSTEVEALISNMSLEGIKVICRDCQKGRFYNRNKLAMMCRKEFKK